MQFYIVDVFGKEKYSGNQLAVNIADKDIRLETMQKIAREFNFSETTFVMGRREKENEFDVRIFTPLHEIPFAGHPALGTAFVIREKLLKSKYDDVVLHLGVGAIPVSFQKDGIGWMKQILDNKFVFPAKKLYH